MFIYWPMMLQVGVNTCDFSNKTHIVWKNLLFSSNLACMFNCKLISVHGPTYCITLLYTIPVKKKSQILKKKK